MQLKLICFLFCLLLITACKKTAVNNSVKLRIQNSSVLELDSVIVLSPGGKQVYYSLPSMTYSGYKSFAFLFRYASIEIYTGQQLLKLQPIDYTREEKLNTGNYTYELIIPGVNPNSFTLNCKKD